MLFRLIGYRRRVVDENLQKAFPEKSAEERRAISRKFYAHLCDLIVESIRGCRISKAEITRRHSYSNIELLEAYYDQGRSVTIVGAHYGNWEWVALSLPLATRFQTYGIFRTLSNPFMDVKLKASRERNGMRLIPPREVGAVLDAARNEKITMGYIGDQSPPKTGRHHWVSFLNQDTAAATGYEHFARQHDSPVIYLNWVKIRRGHYVGTFYPIMEHAAQAATGEIIEAYMKRLEAIVREKPEHWLWSHRRWKLKKPVA